MSENSREFDAHLDFLDDNPVKSEIEMVCQEDITHNIDEFESDSKIDDSIDCIGLSGKFL